LQVSIAVFSGTVEIFFGQRWLSPLEKIGPYAYDRNPLKLSGNFPMEAGEFPNA